MFFHCSLSCLAWCNNTAIHTFKRLLNRHLISIKCLPTESVDSFVAELRNLAKTCNFCDCLRDSLIRDRIVLGIKNEQTTKKLLRMRDLTLNRCIDVCRSEEVAELQMKSLSGPVDNINQVKSSSKKHRAPTPVDGRSAKKISCKFCGYDHQPDRKMCPAWGKKCFERESCVCEDAG